MPGLKTTLTLDGNQFDATLAHAQVIASAAGKRIAQSLTIFAPGSVMGIASGAGLAAAAHGAVEYGEKVSILAQRLGISTDAIQEWDYALRQNGSSIESATSFFEKLATARKKALGGDDKAAASFRALGISLDDLKSKRLEDVALQISRVFSSGDPQKLIADLREVGGRGAGEMVAAFNGGLAEMVQSAKAAGVVMSESTVDAMREAADRSKALGMEFVAGLAPAVALMSKLLQESWRYLQTATAMAVGFYGGFQKGSGGPLQSAADSLEEIKALHRAQDEAAESRASTRKKGFTGGADDPGSSKPSREAQREAVERERLAERLRDLQDKHYLNSLSKEERLTELARRRVELATWVATNWSKLSDTGRLKAQIDVESIAGEEQAAARELDKPGKAPKATPPHDFLHNNSDQAVGAYQAAPGPKEIERLLAQIRDSVKNLHPPPHPTVASQRPTYGGIHQ